MSEHGPAHRPPPPPRPNPSPPPVTREGERAVQSPLEAKDAAARAPSSLDLLRRFTYHPPKGSQVERYATLRRHALEYADLLVALTPFSREQSLALTALEESVMWANAAIARNE